MTAAVLGLTEEQLRQRRGGIGGSDIPAILGVDPYRSPWNVFAEKLGIAQPKPSSRFTRWGQKLERVIADEYLERHAEEGIEVLTAMTLNHAERTWQLGTPDRLIFRGGAAPVRGLEIKNKGFFQSAKWGDDGDAPETVPEEVRVQCHWYMDVTGLPRWDVAAFIGGNDYREYVLQEDLELQAMLVEIAERFWRDNVLAKRAPEIDGSEAAWDYLARAHRLTGKTLTADEEAERYGQAVIAAKGLLEAAEANKNLATQNLAARLIEQGANAYNGNGWRLSIGERIGMVAWKDVAAALAQEAGISAERVNELAEQHRGPTAMSPRFTISKSKKPAKGA